MSILGYQNLIESSACAYINRDRFILYSPSLDKLKPVGSVEQISQIVFEVPINAEHVIFLCQQSWCKVRRAMKCICMG